MEQTEKVAEKKRGEIELLDNFALNVRARTKQSLEHAMAIAFAHAPGRKVSHWCVHEKYGLVFFWAKPGDEFHGSSVSEFFSPYEVETATKFTWHWLETTPRQFFRLERSDKACNGDAWNEEAWRIYVEDWGHVGGNSYAICAILPVSAWIGK